MCNYINVKHFNRKCLKTIPFSTNSRSEMKEIIREEKILSNLNCPYILKYNESFLHNEQMCIVTEYCEVNITEIN